MRQLRSGSASASKKPPDCRTGRSHMRTFPPAQRSSRARRTTCGRNAARGSSSGACFAGAHLVPLPGTHCASGRMAVLADLARPVQRRARGRPQPAARCAREPKKARGRAPAAPAAAARGGPRPAPAAPGAGADVGGGNRGRGAAAGGRRRSCSGRQFAAGVLRTGAAALAGDARAGARWRRRAGPRRVLQVRHDAQVA